MGQYYKIVNLDKKEFITPWDFSNGAKLMEFGNSGSGVMAGLAILLADGNNRGGGDLQSDNEIIGSWAGDRIVVAGDYADEGKFVGQGHRKLNLYSVVSDENSGFENISFDVLDALTDDRYVLEDFVDSVKGSFAFRNESQKKIKDMIIKKAVTQKLMEA